MNRRKFILASSALVGGVLLDQAIPFGRVWSFPSEIVIDDPLMTLWIWPAGDSLRKDSAFAYKLRVDPHTYKFVLAG